MVRGSGRDLSNYYFYIAHHPSQWPLHAFGRRASKALVRKFQKSHGHRISEGSSGSFRVCLKVAGMGDLNTVDLGTAVHENLLIKHKVLDRDAQLHYGEIMPIKNPKIGVYIDDLLILFVIARKRKLARDIDTELAEKASAAYRIENVPEAVTKAFTQQTKFTSWGAEVEG